MHSSFEDILIKISNNQEEEQEVLKAERQLVECTWESIVDIAGFSIKLCNPMYMMLRDVCPSEETENEMETLREQLDSRIKAISIMRPMFNTVCVLYDHEELQFEETLSNKEIYEKAMRFAEAGFDEQSQMFENNKRNS